METKNIELIVPAWYLIEHRLWDRVCSELGWDVWAVSDGRMDSDDMVTLDVTTHWGLCDKILETVRYE